MNLQFQPIVDNINKTEIYLQELELMILNSLGTTKFKWNDLNDIKRKSIISDASQKIRTLIENAQEVRETIRHLNREYLRLQLSMRNLNEFSQEIEMKANELELKLIKENFLKHKASSSTAADFIVTREETETMVEVENAVMAEKATSDELPKWDWGKTEFVLPTPAIATTNEFQYSVV